MSGPDIEKPTSADETAVEARVTVVTRADFGRELKRLREARGETQQDAARAIGVSRANFAQWETGKYLPSERNATEVDRHFAAGNLLLNLLVAAKSQSGRAGQDIAEANTLQTGLSLSRVFQQVGRSLAGYLLYDADGNPTGWRHNLQKEQHQTPLSTAYGIKTMLIVGDPYVDFGSLAISLLTMRQPSGWLGRSGGRRAEITATVLDALFRIGSPLSVDEAIRLLAESIGAYTRTRPYLLSCVLQTVLRLRPDSELAMQLIDDLLAARLSFNGSLLWPEKAERDLVRPDPSVVHTARSVVALREALLTHDDRDDIQDAVATGTEWIVGVGGSDDGTVEELIRSRPDGDGSTRVTIRHFTSAWVVQALAGADTVPIARVNSALRTLWGRYEPALGLWAWGNGDLPIWMTLDSVTALRAAALAMTTPPLSPPREESP